MLRGVTEAEEQAARVDIAEPRRGVMVWTVIIARARRLVGRAG
jgi:hypothetical protein